jgi:D-sedoheptulose 7-phosphate isomerase
MNPILLQQYTALREAVAAAEASLPALSRCAELIADCLQAGGKILAAGNGGSAADGTTMTCIGNDFGFEQIFARQVEALGRPGDVLVLFTTSGNSPNLLAAAQAARAQGLKIVILNGRGGGKLAGLGDAEWIVPGEQGNRVQELHGFALHIVLEVVEARLFA